MLPVINICLCILLISLGAFFSGSETGVYRISRLKIRIGVEQKKTFYPILNQLMNDSHGLVFSILIGNNIANYMVTLLATMILLKSSMASHAELITTAVMAPILFVFSEVIPKNIFYYRSNYLMPRFAPLIWFFHKLFTLTGLVKILKLTSYLFSRLSGSLIDTSEGITAGRSNQIHQLIHESREEKILSQVQRDMMHRAIHIPTLKIGSIMTPIQDTVSISHDADRSDLLEILRTYPYTWYPVYRKSKTRVLGYINIYEPLESERYGSLDEFIKTAGALPESYKIIDAIRYMQKNNCRLVLINSDVQTKKKSKVIGIITMKDLVEELTGELEQW